MNFTTSVYKLFFVFIRILLCCARFCWRCLTFCPFFFAHIRYFLLLPRTDPVLDDASRTFATTFYECLIKHRYTVLKSFNMALSDIKKIFPLEQDKFLLLPFQQHAQGDPNSSSSSSTNSSSIHDVKLDIQSIKGSIVNFSPKLPNGNHLHHTTDMIGRQENAIEIYRNLHQTPNKVIVVTGVPKIGKTEVSIEDRALFIYSVFNGFVALMFQW